MMRDKILVYKIIILIFLTFQAGLIYQLYMEENYQIYENVLRFQVRANSDTEEDQSEKMKVRDYVLSLIKKDVEKAPEKDVLKNMLHQERYRLRDSIQEFLQNQNSTHNARISIVKTRFPLRIYGNVVFPAGVYRAFRVDIGAAKGHNWWCAIYPSLCFTKNTIKGLSQKGKKDILTCFDKKERRTLTGKKIRIRFRLLEWLSKE